MAGHHETGECVRLRRGLYGALALLAVGSPGQALAACCVTTHVYVPPPHVVVVPHTYVHPVTSTVHPHTTINTVPATRSLSVPQTVHAKPHHQPVQTVVVTQATPTKKRCEKGQGAGCKNEEETTWSRLKKWLQN